MSKKNTLLIGIGLLFVFAIFSRYIKQGALKSLDFAVTIKVQERIDNSSRLRLANAVGEIMEGSSFLASPELSVFLILLITAWAGVDLKHKRIKWKAISIPLFFGLVILAEIYGKTVVHHPAPPFFLVKNPTTIFPKYHVIEDFSYPSGHAARAVFLAILSFPLLTSRFLPRRKDGHWIIGILLSVYVVTVCLSRIYLGHHWFSDILGGVLIGTGFGLISYFASLTTQQTSN